MAKRVKIEESVDRISSLPDSVLRHILSFLPTNVAVSTCILLTRSRWRDLFPFSNNLDFDQSLGNNPNDTSLFMDSVDRFILLMNGTSIDKFHLKCRDDVDTSRVHSWIAPLSCNIRELVLCIGTRKHLDEYLCSFSLNVPASVCFPCLKTLHLQSFRLAHKDSLIQRLCSSCPVLEDLLIVGCNMEDVPVLSLSSPSLKRLIIDEPHYYQYELVLDTPSLVFLNFTVSKPKGHILKNLCSLREARIHILRVPHPEFLEGLNNVQSLYLTGYVREFLRTTLGVLGEPPLLKNLTRLVLTGRSSHFEMSVVMRLFQCCPNLEEFISHGSTCGEYDVPCFVPSDVPCCVPSRLKSIECRLMHVSSSWLLRSFVESLEYILKNAKSLEKMQVHIWWYCVLPCKKLETIIKPMKKLANVPRQQSKTCEIDVFFNGKRVIL